MKKLFSLALITLLAISLGSCEMFKSEPVKEIIKPGIKIGEMAVEESTEVPYQNIWQFCDMGPDVFEPSSYVTDCEVPFMSGLDIFIEWMVRESKFASNWDAMTWQAYIDGYQIDLEEFNRVDDYFVAKVENNRSRSWIITFKSFSRRTLFSIFVEIGCPG